MESTKGVRTVKVNNKQIPFKKGETTLLKARAAD